MSINEQNKRQSIVLGLLTLVIVVAVIVVSDMSVQRQAERETQNIAELSSTASDTATATFTFTPSLTPTITPTPFPTPWPTPELPSKVSGTTTLQSIELKYQFGLGFIADIAWSPKENKIAVATPLGIRFHDSATLKETGFWPTESDVTALIYTIDGTLISGEASGAINVWNSDGKIGHILRGSEGPIRFLVLSPDERWLATSSGEERIALWDLTTAKLKYVFYTKQYYNNIQPTRGLVFSPDSAILTAFEFGYDEYYWNVITGETIKKLSLFGCDGLPCGPNYRVSTRDGLMIGYLGLYGFVGIRNWDIPSGSPASESIKRLRVGSCDNCGGYNIEFSQDGKRLAAGLDEGLFVFDVASGQRLLDNPDILAQQFAFSPDAKRLAAVTDFGRLKIFDIETGQEITTAEGYFGKPQTVAFSPDEKLLSAGYYSGVVNVWQLTTGDVRFSVSTARGINSLIFSADSQYLSYGTRSRRWYEYSFGTLAILNASNGELISSFKSGCAVCQYALPHPQHKDQFLIVEGKTSLTTSSAKNVIWMIDKPSFFARFLASGDRFIAFDLDDRLVIRSTGSGEIIDSLPVPRSFSPFVTTSTGADVIIGAEAGLYALNVATHQVAKAVRTSEISLIAITPDDRLVAISQSDDRVTILDARTFEQIGTFSNDSIVNSIALSQIADQYWLAIAGDDGIVRVWTFRIAE